MTIYLALCLWEHEVWYRISRKPLEIETWYQQTTNRKWPTANRIIDVTDDVEWPWKAKVMTPNTLSRAQYLKKRLEIDAQVQRNSNRKWRIESQKLLLTAYRKSYMRNRLVPTRKTLTFVWRSIRSFKVMSAIASHSPLNISETVSDRGLVPKDHQ